MVFPPLYIADVAGVTQQQLANALRVSTPLISSWENVKQPVVPSENWLKSYATVSGPANPFRTISGATISVHAVTLGVRRMLADLTAWHQSGVIR